MTDSTWTAASVLLVALLAVPALGAVVVAVLPARRDRQARIVATGFAAVTFALSIVPFFAGDRARGWFAYGGLRPTVPLQPWVNLDLPWVPALGLRFHLGVDGVSYPLVVLTGLLTLLCCAYTVRKVPKGVAPAVRSAPCS